MNPLVAALAITDLPSWALWVGLGALGLGLLGVLTMAVPKPRELTAEEAVQMYTSGRTGSGVHAAAPQVDQLATAKSAATALLKRNKSLEMRINARLEGAGSQLNASEWLLAHTGITLIAGFLGTVLGGGKLLIGIIFLALGALLPWMWLGFKRSRRRKAFSRALPDTLQLMAGSLTAGLSLAQSIDTIVTEGVEPISSEFRRVLVEARLGVSLETALEGVADRFESKDFAWVVMAINIQRRVGGNLAELLETVAGTIREREYMRRQVNALAAEGKLSAFVLGGLPPIFFVYILFTRYDYVSVLFSRPLGWLMLGGSVVILAVGAFWMSRIIKVEVELMTMLFIMGVLLVFTALGLVASAVRNAAPSTGVARSIELIEAMTTAPSELTAELDKSFGERVLIPFQNRFSNLGRRLSGADSSERIRHKLDLAGNPSGWTVDRVMSGKVVGAMAGFALGLLFSFMIGGLTMKIVVIVGATLAGFYAPSMYLYQRSYDRSNRMQRELPDAIDLLTISVESGLGFDAALQQVAHNTEGPLAEEFLRVLREMQIGSSRGEALRAMAERTNVAELRSFVSSMVQADAFGIPIANVLRVQASEMRVKRRQRAEEKAQQVPVKMTIPLIFCILPSLFIVIMGPAVIQVMDSFRGL